MKISDLVITGSMITLEIADKIILYHISPIQSVEIVLGKKIWASKRSGYRPVEWEWSRGRSGNSQHCFKEKGAVDWTCDNFAKNKNNFIELLIQMTEYKRIAVYDGFVHCDYKGEHRQLFKSDAASNWTLIKNL